MMWLDLGMSFIQMQSDSNTWQFKPIVVASTNASFNIESTLFYKKSGSTFSNVSIQTKFGSGWGSLTKHHYMVIKYTKT